MDMLMLLGLLGSVTLFDALYELDVEFARDCREKKCPFCKGRLDLASYSRKPRGGPAELPERYCRRLSLCCSREGCRRRTLPPSCLFMGASVYLCAVIVASCALRQQRPAAATIRRLTEALGVSRRAIQRWLEWFATVFPRERGWQRLRGLVDLSVLNSELPGGLLRLFQKRFKDLEKALIECLRFLAPAFNSSKKRDK
jgi:hypothetical protein